jgi:large subunit ribosomal protein L10
MPPRIRLQPSRLRLRLSAAQLNASRCHYATAAAAVAPTPPPSIDPIHASVPIARYPPTQPPSHKPASFRKSQLHRQYTSLIRTSPLMLVFQHNSLLASEWAAIRRELAKKLRVVDEELAAASPEYIPMADKVKLQVVQTGIFAAALRVVEFFRPETLPNPPHHDAQDPTIASSRPVDDATAPEHFHHDLSQAVWEAVRKNSRGQNHGLEPLMTGPIALLTFPDVAPQHLKAALHVLAPDADFPAPKRKADPNFHEPAVQNGLQKLMLLGARVEGKAFDAAGARWVGKIPGGLDGLRAQLVAMLQGVGAGITNTLEGASRSLYFTMESRKMDMEEKEKPAEEKPAEEKPAEATS